MISRILKQEIIDNLFQQKIIVLIGPRQVGKTTLLKEIIDERQLDSKWINADEPDMRAALTNVTSTQLAQLIGTNKLIVIDEAQLIENIGRTLKLFADNFKDIQVIATGSSAFELRNKLNEPLTGRKKEFHLYPISYAETMNHIGSIEAQRLLETRLIFGMYPEVVTNQGNEKIILQDLLSSYLYKDLLMYEGIQKPILLEKLLQALALQVGSEVSYHELGQLLGKVDPATVEKYIDLLEKTYVIFRLNALSRNVRNEIKKGKKIYFWDNGVRNALIKSFNPISLRNDIGALWENFIVSERMKANAYNKNWVNTYFWRTTDQAEIDYIEEQNEHMLCVECKWRQTKKIKLAKSFEEAYPNHSLHVISNENFVEFIK